MRHGIAEDAGPGTPDAERRLTDKGRDKLDAVLRLARKAGVELDLILSSPLVRAVETAEMARKILDVDAAVQHTSVLTPESSPQNVWQEVRGLRKLDSVLLAGHEPLFSHLAAFLLGTPQLQVHMSKAALVCIEVDHFGAEPRGILYWMVTPKIAGA